MKPYLISLLLALGIMAASPLSAYASEEHEHEEEHHEHSEHDDHEEGKTVISPESAKEAGVKTEQAAAAVIQEKLLLNGRIVLNQNATAEVKARFEGIVIEIRKNQGDMVAAGEVLAMVDTNASLQKYAIKAPLSGIVIERHTHVGDVTGNDPLFVIADLNNLWAEFHVFPRDLERVKLGQKMHIHNVDGDIQGEATLSSLLPMAESTSQTVIGRAVLDNKSGKWRSGMMVQGDVVINESRVPLAVKNTALQRLDDSSAVFVQEGDRYEARKVETRKTDGTYTEVLSGLEPGATYVTENSFLIKADIEKSGAQHEH